MPKLLKVVLLLAAGCTGVAILLGIAGYFWFKSQKDEWKRGAEQAQADAARFSEGRYCHDCVKESLTRLSSCSGLNCEIGARLFLSECLRLTQPVDSSFCSGVPKKSEFLDTVSWRMDRCEQYGLEDDQGCPRILEEWQEYCAGEL